MAEANMPIFTTFKYQRHAMFSHRVIYKNNDISV